MIVSTIALSSCYGFGFNRDAKDVFQPTERSYIGSTEYSVPVPGKTEINDYSVPVPEDPDQHVVTFDLGSGDTYISFTNTEGYVLVPEDPVKSFAVFNGWYLNDEQFNFNTKVNTDITLTAKWLYDYPSLVNYVYQNTIKSCVKIKTAAEKNGFISRSASDSVGSGIIYEETDYYYYVLTNNHVVYYDKTKFDTASYYVYDCYLNEYQSRNVKVLCADPTYDLAVVRFAKGGDPLTRIDLGKVNLAKASTADEVLTLGNPKSLANAISIGKILGKKKFNPSAETRESSYVEFDVLVHNAFIDNGSSGGALLNYNLDLVGINFASSVSESTGEFLRGYSIPVERVREFLSQNNIQYV